MWKILDKHPSKYADFKENCVQHYTSLYACPKRFSMLFATEFVDHFLHRIWCKH